MLDMFNSVEDPSAANWTSNVSWELKLDPGPNGSTEGRGEAVLNCAVNRGEQIFSSFGPKGNRTLLGCYGYCRWDNPFERVAIWVSALRLLSRDEDDASENMALLERFQQFAAAGEQESGEDGDDTERIMIAGLRFDVTVQEPLPARMIAAARVCCGDDENMALAYLRELVVESTLQVLGGDSVDELEEQASTWRAKRDGSTVHIEVSTAASPGQEEVQIKSYACSPEACALCYRHSQLAVLRAVDAALAQQMGDEDGGDSPNGEEVRTQKRRKQA